MNNSYLEVARAHSPDDLILKSDYPSKVWKEVFQEAYNVNASDIHVQQFDGVLRIKLRVFGDLYIYKEYKDSNDIRSSLINRLKTIAVFSLNINDDTQDRGFTLKLTNCRYRGVVAPGVFGENFVFRIIREEELPNIKACKLPLSIESDLLIALNQKQGFICITGPTGSGKSTTLQACLMEICRIKKNIITIEDPVERIIPDIVQQQVSAKLTWGKAIKAAMRQDPDVILVGEIRDHESATLALEAAQTGHLVLSTLHTNDVAGIVDRLIGLGVERKLIADNLLFISAQRLTQKLCPKCKIIDADWGFLQGDGCEQCSASKIKGIIGRIPMLEYSFRPSAESVINFNKIKFESQELKTTLGAESIRLAKEGLISKVECKYWNKDLKWVKQNQTQKVMGQSLETLVSNLQ